MTTCIDEYSRVLTLKNHKTKRKVEVFLGKVTGEYVVNVTEKGEWYDAEFLSTDYLETLKAAQELFINGPSL